MNEVKKVIIISILLSFTVLGYGCGGGEKGETKPPAVRVTSSITSQGDATTHTHVIIIPFTDVSATPAADIFQYRSDVRNGHSHVIAISKQQMIDMNNGMRLVLASSSPDTGAIHTHLWNIQGGVLLYDKYCYNCHGNNSRGRNPMNVSFNASQTSAEVNPSSAPLSTSLAATPDPLYLTTTVVSLDGAALYAANCSACHGSLASSNIPNRTFTLIKGAITNNSGGMASLGSLTDAQLQAVATALIR